MAILFLFLTRSILDEVFQLYLHKFPISHYFHPVGLRSFHRSFSEFNFPDLRRRKLSVKVCMINERLEVQRKAFLKASDNLLS